jgi:hypothetical protein
MSPLHFATILSIVASVGLEVIESPRIFLWDKPLAPERVPVDYGDRSSDDRLDGVHAAHGKSALTLCRYMKFLMMLM